MEEPTRLETIMTPYTHRAHRGCFDTKAKCFIDPIAHICITFGVNSSLAAMTAMTAMSVGP